METIQPHLQLKIKLLQFWERFGGKKQRGEGFTKDEKIAALIDYSKIVIVYRNQTSIAHRREKFDGIKSVMHKMHIRRNSVCFACGGAPDCRHHIVQLQNGGINSKKNIVSLCNSCHSKIHPWL